MFEHVPSVMPGREKSTSDCLMINGYDCKLCRGSKSGRLRRCSQRRRSDGVLGPTLTLDGWSATAGAATPGKPPATSPRSTRRGVSAWLLAEVVVHELQGDGALPDGGRDPLDRPIAHITDREDTGDAGFQQQGRARKGPSR
jgi:hypothetical protein